MRGGKKSTHIEHRNPRHDDIYLQNCICSCTGTLFRQRSIVFFSLGHSFQMWGITTAWNAASAPASAPATQIAETKTKMKERFTSARMVKGTRTFHRFVLLDSNTIAAFKLSRVFWDSFFTARVSLGFVWKNFLEQGVWMCVFASVFIWVCVHFISAFWIKKDVLWRFVSFLLYADHWTYQTNKIRHLQRTQCCVRSLTLCDLDPAHTYSKTPPMYSPWSKLSYDTHIAYDSRRSRQMSFSCQVMTTLLTSVWSQRVRYTNQITYHY